MPGAGRAFHRFLHVLLRAYPRDFRREYGREWIRAAYHRLARLREEGRRWPRCRLTLFLLRDAVTGIPAARSSSRPHAVWRQRLDGRRQDVLDHLRTAPADVRFGLRMLRRRPLFLGIAVGTLGLGIGATTAFFSVIDGVLLRPLAFERPDELVTVFETFPGWREHPQLAAGWDRVYLAWPDYSRWRDGQSMFRDVAIYRSTAKILTGLDTPERIVVGVASSSLFQVLEVPAALGRTFLPGEDGPAAPKLALLSHDFWVERWGGGSGVLGQSLTLNDESFTIVGVLPAGFRLRGLGLFGGTATPELWIPIGADGGRLTAGNHNFEGIARLKPGVGLTQAEPETARLLRGEEDSSEMGARLTARVAEETSGLGPRLYLLFGSAVTLLLIACGNVAMLLVGEVAGRRHEMATRLALGAGRAVLVRQLLIESVLLGLAGSALGVLLAIVGTKALLGLAPPLPRLDAVGVSGAVLAFAVGVGVLTGLAFGLAPSLDVLRDRIGSVLRTGAGGWDRRASILQRGVISLQVALTVILLVSGGLLLRSLDSLFGFDPGFNALGLAEIRVQLPRYRYPHSDERLAVFEQMREVLQAIPGVESVSGTSHLPFADFPNLLSFGIVGATDPPEGSRHASVRAVMPGYFRTLGIPVLSGRTLTRSDGRDAPRVALVSESMARQFWPGSPPLGSRLDFGDTLTVVGIVGDVRHESMDAAVLPTLYVPLAQGEQSQMSFAVRTSGDADALLPRLRSAVWSVDANAPVRRVATMSQLVARSARDQRFRTAVLLAFGICAALLAGAGVYGITARSVTHRSRELGIRMALGARASRLSGMLVAGNLVTGLTGVGLGLLGALAAGRLLSAYLFGVGAWDPPTYSAVVLAVLLIGATATFVPARRAGRISPMNVLAEE